MFPSVSDVPPSTSEPALLSPGAWSLFLSRLLIATLSLLLLVMTIRLLQAFQSFLQPLFIAVFIGYLIQPIHARLVQRGVPTALAYGAIVLLVLAGFFGLGAILYHNVQQAMDRWETVYRFKVTAMLKTVESWLPGDVKLEDEIRALFEPGDQVASAIRAALGSALNFFTGLAITGIYLVFLVAEKVGFPRRLVLAFGEAKGLRIMEVIGSINQAISEYIAVKTFVSVMAGLLSMILLAAFGLDFYVTWGLLIFLLNYIPYLGSLVAVALPIALSFIQLGFWEGIVIALVLMAIQQAIGMFVEPRLAGNKLGVSPLLILLSLSFWGVVWGIPGMILAVPLLMILKIILANIEETKPLATLMSNV